MTTALDMIPAIGATVLVRYESVQIKCTVANVKNSWGQPRLLVTPVAGSGSQWVEMGRVSVTPDTVFPMNAGKSLVWREL